MQRQGLDKRHQAGAALVIGLILLMVLTLLAVAGMNSASLEFVMAGNEQYRQNAFQAAETGIEQGILTGTFNPGDAAKEKIAGAMPDAPTDNYAAEIERQMNGAALPALWGNSWNSFATYHFQIVSTGTSVRSANAVNTQGIAVISPWDSTILPDAALGNQLTP
jgi:type IV pilus assembly protein PilX